MGAVVAPVDIVFLLIVGLSCLMGLWRGFVKEALSLAAWVAAIVVAGLFHPHLGGMLTGLINNDTLRVVLAFGLLFVLTVFVGTLVGNLFSRMTSAAGLGGTDRVLGCLFGVLRGVIIVVLVVMLTLPLEFARTWYSGSQLVPYIVLLGDQLLNLWESAPAGAMREAGPGPGVVFVAKSLHSWHFGA